MASVRTVCGTFAVAMTLACGDVAAGGSDTGAPLTDPFADAGPYATNPYTSSSTHNAGRDCMAKGCHSIGGDAPPFLIGGTVYSSADAGPILVPVADVEVRVLDLQGNAASAYSDVAGNFYVRSTGTNVTFPAIVGLRDATHTRSMVTELTGTMGSCSQVSCHTLPGYGPLTFP